MTSDEKAVGQEVTNYSRRAPRSPRYESLTAWRGAACLLVIVYHSTRSPLHDVGGFNAFVFGILGKCWMGVPLFFVISGYCVTASADALRWRDGPAKQFFWRRFRRIYPPYWAALALTALCACLMSALLPAGSFQSLMISHPQGLTKSQWLGNLSLTETWRWHFIGGAENAVLPQSWTLCYEEQFYFLVGLVLILTRRFFFSALLFLTLIVTAMFLFPWPGLHTEGLFLDGQWLMFASGILVYYVSNYILPRWWVWYCLPLVIGVLNAVADPRQIQQPLNQSYLAAFSFALLIMGLKRWDDYTNDCRVLSPLRFCGEMCYSLYLVHWLVVRTVGQAVDSLGADSSAFILLIRIPLCVALTILLGTIFHRLVERKFLNPGINKPKTNGGADTG